MDIPEATDTFLIKAMRKRNSKRKNQIKILAVMFLLSILILNLITRIDISFYRLFNLEQRLIIVCIEVLIGVTGVIVLRKKIILYGLEVNPPKDKQTELVFYEIMEPESGELRHTYYICFKGDETRKGKLNQFLDDVFFQRSITFYSRELVNILWDLKKKNELIRQNGQGKAISDIASLMDAYKAIMTSISRKKQRIAYLSENILERIVFITGKAIVISTNKNESEVIKALFESYGFQISCLGQ